MRTVLIAVMFVELLLRGALLPHVHARAVACEHSARPHIHLRTSEHAHHHHGHHHHGHHHSGHHHSGSHHTRQHPSRSSAEQSNEQADHSDDVVYLNNDPVVILATRFRLPNPLTWVWLPVALGNHLSDYVACAQATALPGTSLGAVTPRQLLPHLLRI